MGNTCSKSTEKDPIGLTNPITPQNYQTIEQFEQALRQTLTKINHKIKKTKRKIKLNQESAKSLIIRRLDRKARQKVDKAYIENEGVGRLLKIKMMCEKILHESMMNKAHLRYHNLLINVIIPAFGLVSEDEKAQKFEKFVDLYRVKMDEFKIENSLKFQVFKTKLESHECWNTDEMFDQLKDSIANAVEEERLAKTRESKLNSASKDRNSSKKTESIKNSVENGKSDLSKDLDQMISKQLKIHSKVEQENLKFKKDLREREVSLFRKANFQKNHQNSEKLTKFKPQIKKIPFQQVQSIFPDESQNHFQATAEPETIKNSAQIQQRLESLPVRAQPATSTEITTESQSRKNKGKFSVWEKSPQHFETREDHSQSTSVFEFSKQSSFKKIPPRNVVESWATEFQSKSKKNIEMFRTPAKSKYGF